LSSRPEEEELERDLGTIIFTLQLLCLRFNWKIIRGANIRRFSLLHVKCLCTKEVKVRGGKAPYAGNALKVMPIVPSAATFYDGERP
jgi:hypothetical protein